MAARVVVVMAAALAFLVSFVVLQSLSMLGFPDNHITAYDHATILPHRLFAAFSALVGCTLIVLVVARVRGLWRCLLIAAAVYMFASIGTFYVVDDVYLTRDLRLDDGGGG